MGSQTTTVLYIVLLVACGIRFFGPREITALFAIVEEVPCLRFATLLFRGFWS